MGFNLTTSIVMTRCSSDETTLDGVARPTRTFQKAFLETDLSWDFNNTTVALLRPWVPTAPFIESVSLGPAARDDAGNPVIVSGCTFQVRPWLGGEDPRSPRRTVRCSRPPWRSIRARRP
jgi:hypothetical protein